MSKPAPLDRLRPSVRRLRAYTPGEQVRNCTKLNTNESAYPCSPAVMTTLASWNAESLRLYPQPLSDDLRRLAARHYGCEAGNVLVGNGSDDCLTILYRSFCGPESHVICPSPTYGLYDTLAGIQDCTIKHVDWAANWQLPDSLFGQDAALTLIANPNNPSATLVPVTELCRLADSLPGILVVDEAYGDFAPAGSSMIPHLAAHPNVIVLRTFSKSYSLAGARLGLMFGHADLIAELMKVKDSYNVNALTQAVGAAALQDTHHHSKLVAHTLSQRQELEAGLKPYGWTWPESHGNFLLCAVGADAERLYRGLKERGILVRWWSTPALRQSLRITVGTAAEHQRLFAALAELNA